MLYQALVGTSPLTVEFNNLACGATLHMMTRSEDQPSRRCELRAGSEAHHLT